MMILFWMLVCFFYLDFAIFNSKCLKKYAYTNSLFIDYRKRINYSDYQKLFLLNWFGCFFFMFSLTLIWSDFFFECVQNDVSLQYLLQLWCRFFFYFRNLFAQWENFLQLSIFKHCFFWDFCFFLRLSNSNLGLNFGLFYWNVRCNYIFIVFVF